jgi:hypothetical protein
MKVRFWSLFLVIAFVSPAAGAARTWSGQGPFHPPRTAAEMALDFALNRRDGDNSALTSSLLDFVTKVAERKTNGTCTKARGPIDTLLCEEFDFDRVMTCGGKPRDVDFLYRTTSSNDHDAEVDVVWARYVNVGTPHWNTYRLVKGKTSWMIDGIDCGGLYKYNISVKDLLDVFHLATSDPEKVLEKIYRFNEDKTIGLYGFIFNYPIRNRAKDKELARFFSKAFLDRSEKEEKALIRESCDGKYPKNGMPCDMIRGSNPIICAQDIPEFYLYRTIALSKKEAIVISTWPKDMIDGPAYRLVQRERRWVLDAIYCDGYGKYPG